MNSSFKVHSQNVDFYADLFALLVLFVFLRKTMRRLHTLVQVKSLMNKQELPGKVRFKA